MNQQPKLLLYMPVLTDRAFSPPIYFSQKSSQINRAINNYPQKAPAGKQVIDSTHAEAEEKVINWPNTMSHSTLSFFDTDSAYRVTTVGRIPAYGYQNLFI